MFLLGGWKATLQEISTILLLFNTVWATGAYDTSKWPYGWDASDDAKKFKIFETEYVFWVFFAFISFMVRLSEKCYFYDPHKSTLAHLIGYKKFKIFETEYVFCIFLPYGASERKCYFYDPP